jgi:hypothetical protein
MALLYLSLKKVQAMLNESKIFKVAPIVATEVKGSERRIIEFN